MMMQRPWRRAAALISLGLIYVLPVSAQTWDSIREAIRKKFPSVRQLPTQALAEWLADTNRAAPLLIDARSAAEFAVSHLQNARHLSSVAEVKAAATSNSQPMVVYCSVGYRSSALAEKLQKAGMTNVYNLEGSIFAWANENRPVFRDGTNLQPAQVHPYSRKWGALLDKRWHAPE
jgi:rhodanese-related sulfurtransferase